MADNPCRFCRKFLMGQNLPRKMGTVSCPFVARFQPSPLLGHRRFGEACSTRPHTAAPAGPCGHRKPSPSGTIPFPFYMLSNHRPTSHTAGPTSCPDYAPEPERHRRFLNAPRQSATPLVTCPPDKILLIILITLYGVCRVAQEGSRQPDFCLAAASKRRQTTKANAFRQRAMHFVRIFELPVSEHRHQPAQKMHNGLEITNVPTPRQ
jgi:hypothetical protein